MEANLALNVLPTRWIELGSSDSGQPHALVLHEFGPKNAKLAIHLQAGLHADETPGCVVLFRLADRLAKLHAQERLLARITVLPAANPIGATQYLIGDLHCGRFDLSSGENFNRNFPDLRPVIGKVLERSDQCGKYSAEQRFDALRVALQNALQDWPVQSLLDKWRVELLKIASGADWVLDLHCDQEAVTHLYTAPALWQDFKPLAQLLHSQVQLLDSTASLQHGHGAFDTACFQPWLTAQSGSYLPQNFKCRAATIELKGQSDVSEEQIEIDVEALLSWLKLVGALKDTITGDGTALQALAAVLHAVPEPLPLESVESIVAQSDGIFVPDFQLGRAVKAGQCLGRIYDLQTHHIENLCSQHDGLAFARTRARAVTKGLELIKIAGRSTVRVGPLLSK